MKFTTEHRQKIELTLSRILTELWHRKWSDKISFITQGYAQEKADELIKSIEALEPFADIADRPVIAEPVTHAEVAITQGDRHADEHWKNCYIECIRYVAEHHAYFTSDEIVERMKLMHPGITTHDNRASGGLIVKCAADGWCVSTDQKKKSNRPTLHYPANQLTVWRSLISPTSR